MPAFVSLLSSANCQGRIIGALMMREILTRYGRHNIGFMWLFIEPMMFTTGVLILWTALGLHHVRLPMIAFSLSGYASVLVWRNAIGHCGNAVEPNRALLHHRNVRVVDLFAARIVLELAGASMSFMILACGLTVTGLMSVPDDVFKMIVAWLLLCWFSMGMALVIGSVSVLSESAARVWHVLSYLFLPLSGAFYMVDWLPKYAQDLVIWIPTVSCTELLREGLFGAAVVPHYKLGYLAVVNTILMWPGLLLVKYIAAHVEGE
jgi:capsular polysaccharide transport system permease protein